MNKTSKRIISVVMVLAMSLSLAATAFAAEVTSSGGSATATVSLSSVDSGGKPAGTAMSVSVPTSLPVSVCADGSVVTASNCKIVNNSFGAVKVSSVTVNASSGWKLRAFGSVDSLAQEKVDSKQIGFAISIGGGSQLTTKADNASTQRLLSTASNGCYMSGRGDAAHNSVNVVYGAIVTPLSTAVTNASVANVVFVVEWDAA